MTLCVSLALAVDQHPDKAALWKEYRAALATLLEVGTEEDEDSDADFGAAVSAPILDKKKP